MKTLNNEKNKYKKNINKRCLSPSYGNIINNDYNIKNQFHSFSSGLKEIKSSKSFTRNNNIENYFIKKKELGIKKLFLNKVDNCNYNNKKIINLVFKRGVKNLSHNTRNTNQGIKIIKHKLKNKAMMNNIKTINNTSKSNNSKIKLKILKK